MNNFIGGYSDDFSECAPGVFRLDTEPCNSNSNAMLQEPTVGPFTQHAACPVPVHISCLFKQPAQTWNVLR